MTEPIAVGRVVLRRHDLGDHDALTALWSDPAVVRHIGGRAFTAEEAWHRLQRYAGQWALHGWGFFAVEVDGRFVGEAGPGDFRRGLGDDFDGRPEYGWVFSPAVHGTGIAREAVAATLRYADEALAAPESVCLIDPANVASVRLAERLGFKRFDTRPYHDRPSALFRRPRGRLMARARTRVEQADAAAVEAAADHADKAPVRLAQRASKLLDQPPLIAMAGVTIAAGLLSRRPKLARTGARMLASHLLATKAKGLVKGCVDRTRPHAVDRGDDYRMEPGDSHDKALRSFPSGHTAGAVAVVRAAGHDYPRASGAAAAASAAAVAALLPRKAHYPTDIAAGAAVGWWAELAVDLIADAWSRGRRR